MSVSRPRQITSADLKTLRKAFSYNHVSGVFEWKISRRGVRQGICGTVGKHGYLQICLNGRTYLAHRVAWALTFNQNPCLLIDHIDGNKLNNAIKNLRHVTASMNTQNVRKPRFDNSTGFLGVSFYSREKKFVATISVGRTTGKHIKKSASFDNPQDAHAWYVKMKRELHAGGML